MWLSSGAAVGPISLLLALACGDPSGTGSGDSLGEGSESGTETGGDGDGDTGDEDTGTADGAETDLPPEDEFDCFDGVFEPGELCLFPRGPLIVPGIATTVEAADVDGDGHMDLVVASVTASDLTVWRGDGTGNFLDPVATTIGQGMRSVALGELDGNPGVDLAFANLLNGLVGTASGAGDGSFVDPVAGLGGYAAPRHVVAVDLDGDGQLDLAIADEEENAVHLRFGPGFTPGETLATGDTPYEVAAGDLDGDGNLDLLSADQGSSTVSVLMGQGDGTFAPAIAFDVGAGPRGLALGDLDGDGDLDVVTADYDGATLSVLHNDGVEGELTLVQSLPIGEAPYTVELEDMDGDGHLDAVAALAGLDAVGLARGGSDGEFGERTAISTGGTQPLVLAITDLDEDGRPDIAVGNSMSPTVGVLLSTPP